MSDFLAKKIIFAKIPNSKGEGIQQDKASGPYFQKMLTDFSNIIGPESAILITPGDIDLYESIDQIDRYVCDKEDVRSKKIFNANSKVAGNRYRKAVNEINVFLSICDVLIIFVHEDFAAELPYYFSLDVLDKPLRSLPVQDYGYHVIDLDNLTITTIDNMTADSFGK